jgi:hypothetical protein
MHTVVLDIHVDEHTMWSTRTLASCTSSQALPPVRRARVGRQRDYLDRGHAVTLEHLPHNAGCETDPV